jgi:hypothetical protein
VRLAAVAATVAALGLLTGSCRSGTTEGAGSSKPGPTVVVAGEPVPVSRLKAAATGLCTALHQAPDNPRAAETTFYDKSHDTLHTIARGLEEVDRPQAAALLEAVQRVEADFAGGGASGGRVADDVRSLARVTRAGLARLEVRTPACE